MAVLITQIADAIANTLATATLPGGATIGKQSYDELKEAISNKDCPLVQVYWEGLQMDPEGNTDRSSFGGGTPGPMRQKVLTFHADLYNERRNHLKQNWGKVHQSVDAIINVLETQDVRPYFGQDGIKAWQLESATRAVLEYGGEKVEFVGARFVFLIRVF